jgi:hypothetical protein
VILRAKKESFLHSFVVFNAKNKVDNSHEIVFDDDDEMFRL